MNPYLFAVSGLLLAAIAQTSIAWLATERFLQKGLGRRQSLAWLAIALGAGFLALQHGYTLELALRTGLYDLRQAMLAAIVSLLFALGTYGLRPQSA
jgi:hypothetical protein